MIEMAEERERASGERTIFFSKPFNKELIGEWRFLLDSPPSY